MLWGIIIVLFLELIIVFIFLEVVLILLMQVKCDKFWYIVLMVIVGCIIGVLFGYVLGYFLFDVIGSVLIDLFGIEVQFECVEQKMVFQGFWFVLMLGIVFILF